MMKIRLLAASALAAGVVIPSVSMAQDVPSTGDATQVGTVTQTNNNGTPADDVGTGETIVVTGSRIARPALESASPITSLSADQLLSRGNLSIGDALNDLPSLRSTFSQANSTRFIGTTGLNVLDLRGLGTSRTLVLVNGKRHITSSEGDFTVDTNTIPVDLVERVDTVTGGTSAVYGSDAIAGVVNFVLKRNYEGISLRAQGGVTDRGDRGSYFAAGTFGKNFSDGRGNVAVALEYAKTNTLSYLDRPGFTGAYTGRRQFNGSSPVNNDDVPDRTFFNGGVYSLGLSEGGTFIPYNAATSTSCVSNGSVATRNPLACRANGFPRVFRFNDGGRLEEANYGTTDFRPFGSGNAVGATGGSTLSNYGVLQPGLQRYSANVLAHYDVSDGFKPYIEAKYVRVESAQESSPTFAQNGSSTNPAYASNSAGVPIFFDNAFLNPADAALIRSTLVSAANPNPSFFRLSRNNLDFGSRGELATRQTYRIVAGVEGDFNGDWHYDVSFNYGRFDNKLLSKNNRIEARFRNAADAVRNGAGQAVCRINADTSAANDDANCIPISLLGANNATLTPQALSYFMTNTNYKGRAEEYVVNGFIKGDSSQLFELPGGPVSFSLGGEYRRETASSSFDELVSSGQTFLNAIAPFNPPAFEVKEAFGEINVPLIKDVFAIEELTFSGAGRVSDFKGSTGTVYSYNAGVVWAPIHDIRLRASYSRAVRAPTLSDLYSSPSQNFAFINDPCDRNYSTNGPGNGANRQANCRALGLDPTTFENSAARSSNLAILSGGNANLSEEKSDSYTYGVVLQPRFLPGFTLTADYYDIKVKSVISSISGQQTVDSCFDSASLDNQYCSLINPRQSNGFFASPALLVSSVNFSALRAKGIDLDANYQYKFSEKNSASLRFIGNYVKNRSDFPYLDTPDLPERIRGELGDPIYSFNASANVKLSGLTLGYQVRYIGKQSVTDWEATHDSKQGPAYDPDYSDPSFYPDVWYHDFRVGYDVDEKFNFYVGVDNAFDRLPPLGLLGTSDGGAIFSNTGRFLYAGVKTNF